MTFRGGNGAEEGEYEKKELKKFHDEINKLISDQASCSSYSCRCWEAKKWLRHMADYAYEQSAQETKISPAGTNGGK